MSYVYRDGHLKITSRSGDVDIVKLLQNKSNPVYIYDLDSVEERLEVFKTALAGCKSQIHYALKANSHPALLQLIARLGGGADTVSAGEIRRALAAGIPASHIIFSGVGKTKDEIRFALNNSIKQINVESPAELTRIAEIARELGKTADVAFRLNPDVNAKTHPYITTGFRENKFGMDETFVPELMTILKKNEGALRLRGLTMHIGSQIIELDVLLEALRKTLAVHKTFVTAGFKLDRIDVGGGVGIRYETDDEKEEMSRLAEYAKLMRSTIHAELPGESVEILFEPGRILTARCGILVGEVQYTKPAPAKNFAILNTGMNHLIRPALYGAKHRVLPLTLNARPKVKYDIVGPICESADFLAKDVELPELESGDLIAIADCGAYGYAMASRYNSHELPHEIAVAKGQVVADTLEVCQVSQA